MATRMMFPLIARPIEGVSWLQIVTLYPLEISLMFRAPVSMPSKRVSVPSLTTGLGSYPLTRWLVGSSGSIVQRAFGVRPRSQVQTSNLFATGQAKKSIFFAISEKKF